MLTEQFKRSLNSHLDEQWEQQGIDQEHYRSNLPFAHSVFENFVPVGLLKKVLKEFPAPTDPVWTSRFRNTNEIKLGCSDFFQWGPYTKMLLIYLNSAPFLKRLEALTGISNIIPDPYYLGGGLHCLPQGGKLNMHVDFNLHSGLNLDRRLNLLIYLNMDWRAEYGGELIMQSEDKKQEQRVVPEFNRAVLFSTTSSSFHGNPEPVRAPDGRTRNSLALYYYTAGRPKHEVAEHSTIFKLQEEQMVSAASQLRHFEKVLIHIKKLVHSEDPVSAVQQIQRML